MGDAVSEAGVVLSGQLIARAVVDGGRVGAKNPDSYAISALATATGLQLGLMLNKLGQPYDSDVGRKILAMIRSAIEDSASATVETLEGWE